MKRFYCCHTIYHLYKYTHTSKCVNCFSFYSHKKTIENYSSSFSFTKRAPERNYLVATDALKLHQQPVCKMVAKSLLGTLGPLWMLIKKQHPFVEVKSSLGALNDVCVSTVLMTSNFFSPIAKHSVTQNAKIHFTVWAITRHAPINFRHRTTAAGTRASKVVLHLRERQRNAPTCISLHKKRNM